MSTTSTDPISDATTTDPEPTEATDDPEPTTDATTTDPEPTTDATTTDPEPTVDQSDQDDKSGKCISNDIHCYLSEDYWQNMEANAEGPLVKVIESLPFDLKKIFQTEKKRKVSVSEHSALKWTKVNEADFDTTKFVELDDADLEAEMVKLAATNPEEINFNQKKFNTITIEDEITDKSLVILENGDMYLPKFTPSERISTETENVISVMGEASFLVLAVLLALLFVILIDKMFKPKRQKWGGGGMQQWMPPPYTKRQYSYPPPYPTPHPTPYPTPYPPTY